MVGRNLATTALRALVQLGAIGAVIAAVVRSLWLATAFVLIMLTIAAVTSARRITGDRISLWAGMPIVSGAAPAQRGDRADQTYSTSAWASGEPAREALPGY